MIFRARLNRLALYFNHQFCDGKGVKTMVCPICKGKIRTLGTVNNNDTNEIMRRKKCKECGFIFFTLEFQNYKARCDYKIYLYKNRKGFGK